MLALSVAGAQAQERPDTRAYARARLAVEDLERIVAPSGAASPGKTWVSLLEYVRPLAKQGASS